MKIVIKNIQAILPDGEGLNKIEKAIVVVNQGVIEAVITDENAVIAAEAAITAVENSNMEDIYTDSCIIQGIAVRVIKTIV